MPATTIAAAAPDPATRSGRSRGVEAPTPGPARSARGRSGRTSAAAAPPNPVPATTASSPPPLLARPQPCAVDECEWPHLRADQPRGNDQREGLNVVTVQMPLDRQQAERDHQPLGVADAVLLQPAVRQDN